MKRNISNIICGVVAVCGLASCADTDMINIFKDKTKNLKDYEYLNDYDALKTFSNPKASPNFKLGVALEADDYNANGLVTRLANANFMELTAGNAMKMASCVDGSNGSMNFETVQSFLANAENNGMSVYGHTLAWHAQQPKKWLESLMADKDLPVDPNASNNFLKISTPSATNVSYGWQIYYVLPTPLVKGKTYHLKMRAKAKNPFKMGFWPYKDGGATMYLADPEVPNEWGDLSWDFTASDDLEQLQWAIGFLEGELCFDDIKLVEDGSDINLVENGNFNAESTKGWRKNSWHGDLNYDIDHEGAGPQQFQVEVKRRCIEVKTGAKQKETWDNQFWIMTNHTFAEGESWEISFDCRANKRAKASTQVHQGAGAYKHWQAIGDVNFTLKWETFTANGTFDKDQAGGRSIAFNLSELADATEYYFDNISFKVNGHELITNGDCEGADASCFIAKVNQGADAGKIQAATIVDKYKETREGNSIPLTDEEKKDTLIFAMDKWIDGMMTACEGKVKTWDVVNEALADGFPDAEGIYALKHADQFKPAELADKFFWQDYLGDLDYVRTAVKLARKYGPEDIKLFINDYNLEAAYDKNAKAKSLVTWIKRWEADGETKIDGIGSQMHVTCSMNADKQKANEEAVVNMLNILAGSKKLVKISELDMGCEDEAGNVIKTENMTEEQHKAMSAYYKFIIEKYFEIIPADQQYGICQWCITDAPANSGWRKGEPVGLWDLDYNRKHTYGGFADGLNGK